MAKSLFEQLGGTYHKENGYFLSHLFQLSNRCRTDFADIQNKKNVEVTDNGKDDF